jgi:hypothetical protein
MQALSASRLLTIWECGLNQSYVERAVSLLVAANPECTSNEIEALAIGRRDTELLALREWTFGARISSVSTCPQCGGKFEVAFDSRQIVAETQTETVGEPGDLQIAIEGFEVHMHSPNSLDLLAALPAGDLAQGARILLRRCVSVSDSHGCNVVVEDLSSAVVDAIEKAMASADPQAEIQLAVSCEECGRQWNEIFDIVQFFWSEIHAWAVRILREIHVLASSYGWAEQDILNLSPTRRTFYLEMVGA